MSNIGGKLTGRKVPHRSLEYMGSSPLEIFLWMRVKEQYYPVGNYEDQYMTMDHTVAREGPSSSRVHQYLPYLAHQAGDQRIRMNIWF